MRKIFSFFSISAFLTLFAAPQAIAGKMPCLAALGKSCLRLEQANFLQAAVFAPKTPRHGMLIVSVNGKIALLKLSLRQLQHRNFCEKSGIVFHPNDFRKTASFFEGEA